MTLQEAKDEEAKRYTDAHGKPFSCYEDLKKVLLRDGEIEQLIKFLDLAAGTHALANMKLSYDDGFKEGEQDIIHRKLDISTAYSLGYKHASKKAIEIITKGL